MNDDHPQSAPDPGAPYRHQELSPRQTFEQYQRERREHLRRMGYLAGEFVPERIDMLIRTKDEENAAEFADWFAAWIMFENGTASRDYLKASLPPHLLPFWDHVERQARQREALERGEV